MMLAVVAYQEDKMKLFWVCFLLLTVNLRLAFSESHEHYELSTIRSIDNEELPYHDYEASEESLPEDYFYELEELLGLKEFTVIPVGRVRDLFAQLERNPRARMRIAGGKCSYRRVYIQGYLKKLGINSGKLYIQCPSKNGRMRLKDQVTGHRYTFSNFHDTNIVAVPNGYNVMDVQFENGPRTLSEYLAEIEASQKLKPLKNRVAGDKGFCYWSIK
jgi:hypothetical protein